MGPGCIRLTCRGVTHRDLVTEVTGPDGSWTMTGHSGGREILSVVAIGPVVVLLSYFVFRTPPRVVDFLAGHAVVGVAVTILCAAVAAYACRRVVQALLRLCGFR